MRQGIEDVFPQLRAELDNLFGVTAWAEPAITTEKGQKIFVATVRAAYTGRIVTQITTFQKDRNNIENHRSVKAIFLCKALIIDLFEMSKAITEQPV
jgi:hypothetical protein